MRYEVKKTVSELQGVGERITHHFQLTTHYSFLIVLLLLTACGANVAQVIPTNRPTVTPTATETPTRTPGFNVSPTLAFTRTPASVAGGPSPTSIFGPTSTPADAEPTPTRVRNPNAPRIEFFTSDTLATAPGSLVTLYWSSRGVNGAVLYRLDENGVRNQLWNVGPDGSLTVATRRSDRGQVVFVLSVGDGDQNVEQELVIPLSCPDPWFFLPSPETCPSGPGEATALLEERFERGRMLYVERSNRVYALFNDGRDPAWVAFENRYNPQRDPESEPSFVPPPPLVQPLRILGFVWRGSDVVRNRLGLGLEPEFAYEGFIQTAVTPDGAESLYVNSADGTVLQLLPGGDRWQIITPP